MNVKEFMKVKKQEIVYSATTKNGWITTYQDGVKIAAGKDTEKFRSMLKEELGIEEINKG